MQIDLASWLGRWSRFFADENSLQGGFKGLLVVFRMSVEAGVSASSRADPASSRFTRRTGVARGSLSS
jgi:hypothetical protein